MENGVEYAANGVVMPLFADQPPLKWKIYKENDFSKVI